MERSPSLLVLLRLCRVQKSGYSWGSRVSPLRLKSSSVICLLCDLRQLTQLMCLGKVFLNNARASQGIMEGCSFKIGFALSPWFLLDILFVPQSNWHHIKSQEGKGLYFHTHLPSHLPVTYQLVLHILYRSLELVDLSSSKPQKRILFFFSSPGKELLDLHLKEKLFKS